MECETRELWKSKIWKESILQYYRYVVYDVVMVMTDKLKSGSAQILQYSVLDSLHCADIRN